MLFNKYLKKKTNTIFTDVPSPPELKLIPKKDNAVVVSIVGELGKELYKISKKWIEPYSEKINADLVILDWAPSFPIFGKFQFNRVFNFYKRLIFIDIDTWANPEKCPNLFNIVPEDYIGIYDDLPKLKELKSEKILLNEYRKVRISQGLIDSLPKFYGNTGIIVASQKHSNLFNHPQKPIPIYHCSEQHYWISQFHENNAKIYFLDNKYNYQYWANNRFKDKIPEDAIIHFSGMHEKSVSERTAFMEKIICQLN